MYIKKIINENIGPIKKINFSFPFNDDKTPKPLIIVGENGSGKSTLLSNIIDAFYEMAGKAFNNALINKSNGAKEYYKIISGTQITIGEKYLYSYIQFHDNNKDINYVFKSGELSTGDFMKLTGYNLNNGSLSWELKENYKNIDIDANQSETIFMKDVICFLGPDRYEKPNWMGKNYFNSTEYEHLSINDKISGKLYNPITVKEVTNLNLQWLMDVIADSRSDIEYDYEERGLKIVNVEIATLLALGNGRKNLERIMSEILGKEIYFGLNFRSYGLSRFNIKLKKDDTIIAPTLDSLSTGQIALFNIFSTIVRYADTTDLQKSIQLEKITGIVVIDEIDLHLHTILQKEILPKLIKLFPKIQFIITTHAPLFLLGMEEEFGPQKYEIYQMPTATKINVECFSEFQKAYNYFKETQTHQQEVKDAIDQKVSNALIITEGATDWKHMAAAYNNLSGKKEISEMQFDFLEYEPKNSTDTENLKLEMGCSQLCQMCENYAKIKQTRKLIFIADRDDIATNNKLGESNSGFKDWGNNVYSLILPLPKHRESTPNICIEHYYTDEEIKTSIEINGIKRRLYIGNEFNEHGHNLTENIFCEKKIICGEGKINIIEGSNKEKVLSFDNNNVNLALPKMCFATKIHRKEAPFEKINFTSFIPLFKIINTILNLPLK